MESIVLNQKKLACEVFYAFSANRMNHNGRTIQPCISGKEFIWQVHPFGYYESDKSPLSSGAKSIEYRIDRDNIAFRASINDMVQYISAHWESFSKSSEGNSISSESKVFKEA